MNSNTTIVLIVLIITIGVIVGAVVFGSNSSESNGDESSSQGLTSYSQDDENAPKAEIKEADYDFGKVASKDEAKHEFEIKNTGKSDLEITDIVSSCGCTTAKVKIDNKTSPKFGMHNNPAWTGKIKPDKNAIIEVTFDADFHPNTSGSVTRTISLTTNDPDNPTVEFVIQANVIK